MSTSIPHDFDVLGKEPVRGDLSSPGCTAKAVQPPSGAIPETKGWNSSNEAKENSTNQAQPFRTKGAGYCG